MTTLSQSTRNIRFRFAHLLVCLILVGVIIASGAGIHTAAASTNCPNGAAACLFVNSNADTNSRDSVLTLREALLLDRGELLRNQLTYSEMQQISVTESNALAAGKQRSIYFDPTVFCDGCETNTIVLSPPGWGGDGPVTAALPPGFGGDGPVTNTPPGWGGDGPVTPLTRLGLSYDPSTGLEGAAVVVIDGTQLDSTYTGIDVNANSVWIRGIRFQNFAGAAIRLTAAANTTVLGTYVDGTNDDAEAVTFSNNSEDVHID
jgi:hypothetical protein